MRWRYACVTKGCRGHWLCLVLTLCWAGQAEAGPFDVGVKGHFGAFMVAADEQDRRGGAAEGRRGHKVAKESEIHVHARTVWDNGTRAGAIVQLEGETDVSQVDESFLWMEGRLGRFEIGSKAGPPAEMHYASLPPSFGHHGLDNANFVHVAAGSNRTLRFPHTAVLSLTAKAERMSYYTPRLGGMQLGLSYVPDVCKEDVLVPPFVERCGGSYSGLAQETSNLAFARGNAVEGAINYVSRIAELDVRLSAAYATGEAKASAAIGADDPSEYSTGVQLGYAGFVLGGGYHEARNEFAQRAVDSTDFNVGLVYQYPAWSFGVQYAERDVSLPGGGEDSLDAVEVGGYVTIGPGIIAMYGLQFWDIASATADPAAENEACIGFLGFNVFF